MSKNNSIQDCNSKSKNRAPSGASGSTTTNSPKPRVMFIQDVRFCTNKNSDLAQNIIYAELVDKKGKLVISATLDEICQKIIERGYVGTNFSVEDGVKGKEVKLMMYAIGQ